MSRSGRRCRRYSASVAAPHHSGSNQRGGVRARLGRYRPGGLPRRARGEGRVWRRLAGVPLHSPPATQRHRDSLDVAPAQPRMRRAGPATPPVISRQLYCPIREGLDGSPGVRWWHDAAAGRAAGRPKMVFISGLAIRAHATVLGGELPERRETASTEEIGRHRACAQQTVDIPGRRRIHRQESQCPHRTVRPG